MQNSTVLSANRLRDAVESRRALAAPVAFALVAMASAAVLLYAGRGTTFYQDEWSWVVERRGWSLDTLLLPHNEHLVLVPLLYFKALFATVGLDPYWPYRLGHVFLQILCVALVFGLARRRVGDLLALALCLPILVLGYAWEVLLQQVTIGFVASLGAGLLALVALEGESRRGDLLACAALTFSIASSSLGLAFIVAAAVAVLLRPRRVAALWIPAVPILLYGLWYAEYGGVQLAGGGSVTANAWFAPPYVLESAALTLSATLGVGTAWGPPLLVAAVILAVRRLASVPPSPRLVALATAALAFWTLSALARAHLGPPALRYVYPGAILILLIGAELASGVRPRRGAVLAVVAIAAVAAFNGLERLRRAGYEMRVNAAYVKAELGALELVRSARLPAVVTDTSGRGRPAELDRYFDAVDELGSPADAASEIRTRSEAVRSSVDGLLVQALGVRVAPFQATESAARAPGVQGVEGGSVAQRGPCVVFEPTSAAGSLELSVPAHGIRARGEGGGGIAAAVRWFAGAYTAERSFSLPAAGGTLVLPSADIEPAWRVRLGPVGDTVRACTAAGTSVG